MYSSKNLDHLGIVSGMIDELDLVKMLDSLLETDGKTRTVSMGILIKALIMNGLEFTQRTLYAAKAVNTFVKKCKYLSQYIRDETNSRF